MTRPTANRRSRRRIVAVVLAFVAILAILVEPLPKGFVVFSITRAHGIDAGDLSAIFLLLVAARLAI
jgi:hypothetical protein